MKFYQKENNSQLFKNIFKYRYQDDHYQSYQGIELELGVICLFVGIIGLFKNDFLGLNLSLAHIFVLIFSGTFAIGTILFKNKRPTLAYALGFFFFLNSVIGFFITKNYQEGLFAPSTLEKIKTWLPGFLELTSYDHFFHGIIGAGFFLSAILGNQRTK